MEHRIAIFLMISFMLCMSAGSSIDGSLDDVLVISAASDRPMFVPGQIIIKFKDTAVQNAIVEEDRSNGREGMKASSTVSFSPETIPEIRSINERFNVKEIKGFGMEDSQDRSDNSVTNKRKALENVYSIKLQDSEDMVSALNAYMKDPNIEYAVPNYIFYTQEIVAQYVPNDPHYTSHQWGLHNINAEYGWNISRGNKDIVIAIIDTGVDWTHEDLAANIWMNPGEVLDGTDTDVNGYIDDIRGWDTVTVTSEKCHETEDCDGIEDNDPMDVQGHGTHCAGIAAATTDNGIGIAGTCPNCSIMAIRAGYMTPGGQGSFDGYDLVRAVYYAIDNDADIISMSLSGGDFPPLRDALNEATAAGIIVIAAAGNSNSNLPEYPAAYPNIISVAAHGESNTGASFTNYGPTINISAPGVSILSTYPHNPYYVSMSGTSMAAPMVAGIIGMMLDIKPDLTAGEAVHILNRTGVQIPNFKGSGLSVPRPDLYETLLYLDYRAPFFTNITPSGNVAINESESIMLSADADVYPFIESSSVWIINGMNQSYNQSSFNFTANYTSAGNHTVTFVVYDRYGENSTSWAIEVQDVPTITLFNRTPESMNITIEETESIILSFEINDLLNSTGIVWYINSTPQEQGINATSFNFSTDFGDEGSYKIEAQTYNEIDTASETWIVDVEKKVNPAPEINLSQSAEIIEIEYESITISYNASHDNLEAVMFNITLDTEIIAESSTNNSDITLTPQNITEIGNYSIMLYANNTAGFISTINSSFMVVDTHPPTLNITQNASVIEFGYEEISLTYNASDFALDKVLFNISIDDETIYSSENYSEYITLGNSEIESTGTYSIMLYANDTSGNTAILNSSFNVTDTIAPVVNITGNSTQIEYGKESIEITMAFSDIALHSSRYIVWSPTMQIAASGNQTNATTYTEITLGQSELQEIGNYTIEVNATDRSSNTGTANLVFEVYNIYPPNITITSPTENGTYTEDSMMINASSDKDIYNATIHFGNLSYPMEGDGRFWSYLLLGQGNYSFNISGVDDRGNHAATDTMYIFLNDTAPSLTLLLPEEQSIIMYETEDITFRINYTDFGPFEPTLIWKINSTDVAANNKSLDFATNYSSAGLYNISVILNDTRHITSHDWKVNVKPATDDIIGDNDSIAKENIVALKIKINGSEDIIANHSDAKHINITDSNTPILEFWHNFTERRLDLRNATIKKQPSGDSRGFTLINGIETTSAKTIYIDRINTSISSVCIRDAPTSSIDNITESCLGKDETPIKCPGIVEDYNCTIKDSRFMITGISHSAARQQTFCGDGIRNGDEECDGDDIWNWTCKSLNEDYNTGKPACTRFCTIDKGTCMQQVTQSSSGSSGGGGGGSASPTSAPIVLSGPKYSRYYSSLESGTNTIPIPDEKIPYESITFTLSNPMNSINFEIQKIDNTAAVPDAPRNAYAYLSIKADGIQSAYLQEIKHRFRIEKSWLNGYDESKIYLQRYLGSSWLSYEANKIEERGSYVIYEAVTPGLSFFAITAATESAPSDDFRTQAMPDSTDRRTIEPAVEQPSIPQAPSSGIGGNQTMINEQGTDDSSISDDKEKKSEILQKISARWQKMENWAMANPMMIMIILAVVALLVGSATNMYYFYSNMKDEENVDEDVDISEFIASGKKENKKVTEKNNQKPAASAKKTEEKTIEKKKEEDKKEKSKKETPNHKETEASKTATEQKTQEEIPKQSGEKWHSLMLMRVKQTIASLKKSALIKKKKENINTPGTDAPADSINQQQNSGIKNIESEKDLIAPKPSDTAKDNTQDHKSKERNHDNKKDNNKDTKAAKTEDTKKSIDKPKAAAHPNTAAENTHKVKDHAHSDKKEQHEKKHDSHKENPNEKQHQSHTIKHLQEVKFWGKKQLDAGFTYRDMKKALKQVGYSSKEIERIISLIKKDR